MLRLPTLRLNAARTWSCVAACVIAVNFSAEHARGQLLTPPPTLHEEAWDTNVVAFNNTNGSEAEKAKEATSPYPTTNEAPATGTPVTGPTTANETDLAKRVAALEEYIRQMQAANNSESLPAPKGEKKKDEKADKDKAAKDKKDASIADECVPKKLDTIIKPTFTPTGRIYFDGVGYSDDPATKSAFHTDRDDELGFRTFRLGGRGNIYENLAYTTEFELRGTNSAITYKDIYMEQQELPVIGHVRAGHFKEPIGLEEDESDLYLDYMEKAPATQAFAPSRNFGVMLWDTTNECQDATWFAGAFRADSPDSPTNTGLWRSDNNDWCLDARYAWLPYYDEPSNGRYLVHLGGSYSFRHIGDLTTTAAYNQNVAYTNLDGKAEFGSGSWVGSQRPIALGAEARSDEWNQIDPELLVIWGAASFQAEYFQVLMNSGEQYNGGYASLSYFLTGESRNYRKDLKVLDRVQPFEPFFWVNGCNGTTCGWGAWEVALGYSWVNLDAGRDITAPGANPANDKLRGFNNDFIVGLNWYQNSWSRMFFDYERELVDFVDAGVPSTQANIFGVRWQVDW